VVILWWYLSFSATRHGAISATTTGKTHITLCTQSIIMSDTYAAIRAEIESKIERAQRRVDEVRCRIIDDGTAVDVMCTMGTQYIVIVDCINETPPHVAIQCLDSLESQKIIEYLGLDNDPDVCPLVYDVYAETALTIGQPYGSVKWRLANVDLR